MPTFEVKGRLTFDHDDYDVGDTVEMKKDEADALLAVGVIAKAESASEPVTQQRIVEAIESLSAEDASLWGKNGAPKVAAIEAVTGVRLTADDRDAAWAIVQGTAV